MNKEFFEDLDTIEKERGVKKEILLEKITKAMEVAVQKDMGLSSAAHINVSADTEKYLFPFRS